MPSLGLDMRSILLPSLGSWCFSWIETAVSLLAHFQHSRVFLLKVLWSVNTKCNWSPSMCLAGQGAATSSGRGWEPMFSPWLGHRHS